MHGEERTDLGVVLQQFPLVYLITTGADRHPHVVLVAPLAEAAIVRIAHTGPTTRRNITGCPTVALLCPPRDGDGHSLIVDGAAHYDDDTLIIDVTEAILHRDNPSRRPGQPCGQQCLRLRFAAPDTVTASP